jgi:hypothetical protein
VVSRGSGGRGTALTKTAVLESLAESGPESTGAPRLAPRGSPDAFQLKRGLDWSAVAHSTPILPWRQVIFGCYPRRGLALCGLPAAPAPTMPIISSGHKHKRGNCRNWPADTGRRGRKLVAAIARQAALEDGNSDRRPSADRDHTVGHPRRGRADPGITCGLSSSITQAVVRPPNVSQCSTAKAP